MKHAKVDEEEELYPQLERALGSATAVKLDMAYRRQFVAVKPLG